MDNENLFNENEIFGEDEKERSKKRKPDVFIIKCVDKKFAKCGDVLHYASKIYNKGREPKCKLFFKDDLPCGTKFVCGSVKINGRRARKLEPEKGFFLPELSCGESVIVEFDAEVI